MTARVVWPVTWPDDSDESLKDRLRDERKESCIDKKKFVPESCLDTHLTKENIEAELERKDIVVTTELVDFIQTKAKKLFAILVYSEILEAIIGCYEHQLMDDHLPLLLRKVDNRYEISSLSENEPSDVSFQVASDVFRIGSKDGTWKWNRGRLHDFAENQWQFMAPVFKKERYRYKLDGQHILPFVSVGKEKGGGFSKVYRVTIHHAHQQGYSSSTVAFKQLDRQSQHAGQERLEKMQQEEGDILEIIRELDPQDPHLIEVFAVIERGREICFIFPWANGGNLREVWEQENPETNNLDWINWAIDQLLGLSVAISRLHHLGLEKRNCRHGDLKPENILHFKGEKEIRGKLVIADVGLARVHTNPTYDRAGRNILTIAMSGTQRYEPPDLLDPVPRSRVYDIWSLGCICLEFIIWLLYGKGGLRRFNEAFTQRKFWTAPQNATRSVDATLEGEVFKWMNWMQATDPRVAKDTALGDLLDLVRDRLLVIKVERGGNAVPSNDCRARSEEVCQILANIRKKAKKDAPYLTKCAEKPDPSPHGPGGPDSDSNTQHRAPRPRFGVQNLPLTDNWEAVLSNDFARNVYHQIRWQDVLPGESERLELCERCRKMDIWRAGFSTSDTIADLEKKAHHCRLCRLFYQCVGFLDRSSGKPIHFYRYGSAFHLESHAPPVLSICTSPGMSPITPIANYHGFSPPVASRNLPSSLQIGFPKLPKAGGPTEIALCREWLRVCDDPKLHSCHPTLEGQLPTRVLEVLSHDSPGVRLHISKSGEKGRYFALSHRWGDPLEHRRFCTLRTNYKEFVDGISFERLPKTFQDAVTVTRSLGVPFLWIDSLCILQDDPEDWETESNQMEDVYNLAYCTLSAACARGTTHGFLQPRAPRDVVTLKDSTGDVYYICKAIDNFGADVEEGELSRRGWILQERAMSRRTIHFTDTQVYWECGDGVHCETLIKMRNPKSAILGDSEFPKAAERLVKGGRIELFQFIYKRYSRLAFTNKEDRSIAICGLENRLIRTFDTRGAYGVFDTFLNRSVLWRRGGEKMNRITYPARRSVPSWSWMAYDGWITYVEVPFGQVDWASSLRFPPSPQDQPGGADDDNDRMPLCELVATATDFSQASPARPMDNVTFDIPGTKHLPEFKCVVVGSDKPRAARATQKYYILVVAPASSGAEPGVYERVGAGIVEKDHLDLQRQEDEIRIR
ncbi:hypothetical protein Z517_08204 [Fonsecaea pedrosoi CBS 271.37]|uniref:Protein kinase domain-containing protein n=1 Tax=Fonsecaea pedrosoi CBS 271.37 TaxID=1442368 RepID=A0A0D2H112_9EURO|nr:uncharacterized protein Z517_08204 [Fonsecaea pedrosoi CBS 271.37]KIW78369.1 hypothetical protein Z517_08204 [Fonsecaea pedrosoi CBS 271.37]